MPIEITKGQLTGLVHEIREGRNMLACRRSAGKPIPPDFWVVYGRDHVSYESSFRPFHFSFGEFLKERDKPIVVDLLAPTNALRGLFRDLGKDGARGIAVSLSDQRTPREKRTDESLGVSHVSGDLSAIATWNKLEEELGEQKADLIVERGIAGCNFLPKNELYLLFAMRRIWKMLSSDSGVFIGQSYHFNYDFISEWIRKARSVNVDAKHSNGIFRIVKHEDSPATLPY